MILVLVSVLNSLVTKTMVLVFKGLVLVLRLGSRSNYRIYNLGLTKYRVDPCRPHNYCIDRLINTASTVSQWLWHANHCSKRPQTPLVVHRLLPTNRRNHHRCRRCHTARRSVQIRHIDPWVVWSGPVWTCPVHSVTSSPSTAALARAAVQRSAISRGSSGPVYAPVIMRSTRYLVIPS